MLVTPVYSKLFNASCHQFRFNRETLEKEFGDEVVAGISVMHSELGINGVFAKSQDIKRSLLNYLDRVGPTVNMPDPVELPYFRYMREDATCCVEKPSSH